MSSLNRAGTFLSLWGRSFLFPVPLSPAVQFKGSNCLLANSKAGRASEIIPVGMQGLFTTSGMTAGVFPTAGGTPSG